MLQRPPVRFALCSRYISCSLRNTRPLSQYHDPAKSCRQKQNNKSKQLYLIYPRRDTVIQRSRRHFSSDRKKSFEERLSWIVYNLGQDSRNSQYQKDLTQWNRDLNVDEAGQLKATLYFTLLQNLADHGKLEDAVYCHRLLRKIGIVPNESEWLLFLQTTLDSLSECASGIVLEVFKLLPLNQKTHISSRLLEYFYRQRLPTSIPREKFVYVLTLFGIPESNKRMHYIFRHLLPFQQKSQVLSNPSFYRDFLRQVRNRSFRLVPHGFLLEFVSMGAKMPKPYRTRVVKALVDAVHRYDPKNVHKFFDKAFWKCLIKSHTDIPHGQITKLMRDTGVPITPDIYENLILRSQDFEECNALSDEYFKNKVGKKDKSSENRMNQISIHVYSHMIRLMCNYSPSDAHDVFKHPSVRTNSLLVVGYLLGLFEARDYQTLVETYRNLEKDKLATSKMWNIYVHALVKTNQIDQAVKLATDSLLTHCPTNSPVTTSFDSDLYNSYTPSKEKENAVILEPKELISSTHTIKLSPIYIRSHKNVKQQKSAPWFPKDLTINKCDYLLDSTAFSKIALAMVYAGRLPSEKKRKRRYAYGNTEPIENEVLHSEETSAVASSSPSQRFSMTQITHFLKLGWNINGGTIDQGHLPGYQLHPQSISLILRDIQRGNLQISKREFIEFIHTIALLYPPETSTKFFPGLAYQEEVFTSSFISRIVFIGYLKSPRSPWISVSLLWELQSLYGIHIDATKVKEALLSATSMVYSAEPVGGELRRVRHQIERSQSVHELAEAFNAAWMNKELNRTDAPESSLPGA